MRLTKSLNPYLPFNWRVELYPGYCVLIIKDRIVATDNLGGKSLVYGMHNPEARDKIDDVLKLARDKWEADRLKELKDREETLTRLVLEG